MAVTLQSAPTRDVVPTSHSDVVMILGYTSWGGAVRRGHVHPEDQLTLALMGSSRVRSLLVCNPFRSRASKLVRAVTGPHDAPFPATASRSLHEPRRLRLNDPVDVPGVERQCATYEASVRRAVERAGLERPAVITSHPLMYGFGRFDWSGPVTYYANDDLSAHPPLSAWWDAYEESYARARVAGRGAVGLTPKSLASVSPSGPAGVIPSGIQPEEWRDLAPAPEWFSALPGPRLLYVGTLDARVDVRLVRAVAVARPEASIVLVGRCPEPEHFTELEALPNVTIHGEIGRSDVQGLVAGADVGLIPHVVSEQTRAMSPLKLYEYLAAGIPVASVELPGIASVCPPRTALAHDEQSFVAAVGRALELGRWGEHDRQQFVLDNTWEQRFEQLLDLALER